MKCKNCGYELRPGMTSCPRCHVPVQTSGPQAPRQSYSQLARPVNTPPAGNGQNNYQSAPGNLPPQPNTYQNGSSYQQQNQTRNTAGTANQWTASPKAAPQKPVQIPSRAKTGFTTILAGSALFLLSMFLPWVSMFGGSVTGIQIIVNTGAGISDLVIGIAALVCALIPMLGVLKDTSKYKLFTIAAYLAGLKGIAELGGVAQESFGVQVQIGPYCIALAGIIILVGAFIVSFSKPDR